MGDLIKENRFTLKESKKQTISCRNYNRCRLHKYICQAESLLHSLEQAAGGINLHVNVIKAEFICFKCGVISTLSGKPLKLVDKFTYFQQYPTCFVHLTLMVYEMRGKWPYSCYFGRCCHQNLFNIILYSFIVPI